MKDFAWEDVTIWDNYVQYITDWEKEERGFVLEVDLDIPNSIHDLCDDLPLAPEKANPNVDDFSDFMMEQWHRIKQISQILPL